MSLNDIDLGGKMLADLYGSSLVAEPAGKPHVSNSGVTSKENDLALRYLGKNGRNYCILVSYENETFMPDDKMDVLIKILQACKISMDDIALVNLGSKSHTVDELRAQLAPTKMVLLGVNPIDIRLPIHFPLYRPQAYAGCTYLYSEPLDSMDNSENGRKIKTSLWNSLKEMFSL